MSLIDSVIRPLAVAVLAATIANCNEGCVPGWTQLSPADAYAMEISGCANSYDMDIKKCANEAGSMDDFGVCKDKAEEEYRICRGNADRKYLGYNSNGSYPGQFYPPSR